MKSITVLSIIVVLILTACGGTGDGGTGNPAPDSGSAQTDGDPKEANLRDCEFKPNYDHCEVFGSSNGTPSFSDDGIVVFIAGKLEPDATVNVLDESNGLSGSGKVENCMGEMTCVDIFISRVGDKITNYDAQLLVTVSKPGVCEPVQKYFSLH